MMNKRFQKKVFFAAATTAVVAFGPSESATAFVTPKNTPSSRIIIAGSGTKSSSSSSSSLAAVQNNNINNNDDATTQCSRRDALFGVAAAAFLGVTTGAVATPPQAAEAKYSDYSRREKDWEERQKNGEVKISTARDLRKQLAEIVPANSEGSKVFCPNGPSAAVSPLMENKCSDVLMAMPSVYGRQSDVVGNSIPGFNSGYALGLGEGTSTSISASIGGMPSYKENEWKLRNK